MTPKEKAQELFNVFYDLQDAEDLGNEQLNKDMETLYKERGEEIEPYWVQLAKKSALKAADEIIKARPTTDGMIIGGTQTRPLTIHYWQEVNQQTKN